MSCNPALIDGSGVLNLKVHLPHLYCTNVSQWQAYFWGMRVTSSDLCTSELIPIPPEGLYCILFLWQNSRYAVLLASDMLAPYFMLTFIVLFRDVGSHLLCTPTTTLAFFRIVCSVSTPLPRHTSSMILGTYAPSENSSQNGCHGGKGGGKE